MSTRNEIPGNAIKITHISGLPFQSGREIHIWGEEGNIVILGKALREWEDVKADEHSEKRSKNFMQAMHIEIPVANIVRIDFLDEAEGSSSRKTLKELLVQALIVPALFPGISRTLFGIRRRYHCFIVMQVSGEGNQPFQVIVGGESQKEVLPKYNTLMQFVHSRVSPEPQG